MPLTLSQNPSANHGNQPLTPKYLILHCLGYSEDFALNLLTQPLAQGGSGASSHYLVPLRESFMDKGYPIYQLVPDHLCAYHAGASAWQQDRDLNKLALGVEFHCPNYAKALSGNLDWFHFENFGDEQIAAGIELLTQLVKKYNIPAQNILAHSDISPYRYDQDQKIILGKTDPGATFPWERLARAGIGLWPKKERTRRANLDTSIAAVQQLLADYGYHLEQSGIMDAETKHVLKAFQMHYLPLKLDGEISEHLVIALENLIDQQWQYQPLLAEKEFSR